MHKVISPSVLYFGTPVALISTLNLDGTTNLSPISSLWALGHTYALGLGEAGHAATNIRRTPEIVINLPDASLARSIERIAPTTGANPVPPDKQLHYRHEPNKWALGGMTQLPSDTVAPTRVAECPIHLEARIVDVSPFDHGAIVAHAAVTRVHARDDVVQPGTSYIALQQWRPLYYTFRHYYAQGDEVGISFKAEQ